METKFIFEHVAYNVKDMDAVRTWYETHLGLKVVRHVPGKMAFLGDGSGRVVFELYHNSNYPCIDDSSPAAYTLHNAFVVDDIKKEMERLVQAGAKIITDYQVTDSGDALCMMADPWGIGLQLLKRRKPMA